jgi:hypothetical protein
VGRIGRKVSSPGFSRFLAHCGSRATSGTKLEEAWGTQPNVCCGRHFRGTWEVNPQRSDHESQGDMHVMGLKIVAELGTQTDEQRSTGEKAPKDADSDLWDGF